MMCVAAREVAVDEAAATIRQAEAAPQVDAVCEAVAAVGPAAASVGESGAAANAWPMEEFVSDDEAARILAESNSGVEPALSRRGYRFAKRAFDLAASGLAIAVLLVPGLVLGAVICAKSPGAGPLYAQTRVGRVRRDGSHRLFRMWKFRSMVPGADSMVAELQASNEADGPLFKIKDDPRVIPGVGQFIRRHSIDELPQLINVFLGQMSLVGPRPALPREVLRYDGRAMRRLAVKAGCGGPWQAGNRSDASFDEMVALDLAYVEHRSVRYDLSLVWKTAKAMVVGEGAY